MKHTVVTAIFLACTLLAGCTGGSSSPAAGHGDPLHALEPYDAVYMLDAGGQVVKLRLEGHHVTATVLDEVAKLPELKSLSLYAATISNDNLTKLQELKMLEELGLGETLITDAGLPHLTKLNRLQWLWLPRRQVSNQRIEELKKALPGLTVYLQ